MLSRIGKKKLLSAPELAVLNLAYPNESKSPNEENDLGDFQFHFHYHVTAAFVITIGKPSARYVSNGNLSFPHSFFLLGMYNYQFVVLTCPNCLHVRDISY